MDWMELDYLKYGLERFNNEHSFTPEQEQTINKVIKWIKNIQKVKTK